MFNLKPKPPEVSKLDEVINMHLSAMMGHDEWTEEYAAMAANLRVLMEVKANEPKPNRVSRETLLQVGGSLAGILMILSFEQAHVMTTKALNFVVRPRI